MAYTANGLTGRDTVPTQRTPQKRVRSRSGLRNRHIFVVDVVALSLIPFLALMLRLDSGSWWPGYGQAMFFYTVLALAVKLAVFYRFGLYRRYWPSASINDLARILTAVSLSTAILTILPLPFYDILTHYHLAVPRTLPILDGLLTGLIVGGARLGLRVWYHWRRHFRHLAADQRVLVVGAGETGRLVAREIRANPKLNMNLVAFVDDDTAKVNTYIESLPVLGTVADIAHLVHNHHIQQMIVAMPTAPLGRKKEIINLGKDLGITTLSLPGIYELLAGHKTVSRLPQIDVARLLHREPISTDSTEIAALIQGARVLVTGAGGSIGSELCRQIARYQPAEIALLGHGENSIFEIALELRLAYPDLVTHSLIVDVRDRQRVDWAVEKHRPNAIFHAAAHKHVQLMEDNIEEAVINNVYGTQNVLLAAERHKVEHFVLISSDKAVNPSSIMGVTKRLAELLVQATARRSGREYMAVRFGNVLGSRGSVIPVFQRQIAAGGPVTITHPDMQRYFMTIPEAVQLVLQAAVLGHGGEIFLLDMGEPVRIVDLAMELIKMSGLELGRDIDMVHAGIRPGEKISEELFLAGEEYRRTKHEKIFVVTRESAVDADALEQSVTNLIHVAQRMETQEALACIRDIVPEFRPKQPTVQAVAQREPQPVGELQPEPI